MASVTPSGSPRSTPPGPGPIPTASPVITPQPAPPPGPPIRRGRHRGQCLSQRSGGRRRPPTAAARSSATGSLRTSGRSAQTPINTGSTGTTYTVPGLVNGTTYTFTVLAINGSGPGPESAPSNPVTPAPPTVPGAPAGVTGAARDRSVALTWTAPASDGGAAITSYRITPYIGANAQTPVNTGSSSTGFTVTGLTNGTAYTFTVGSNQRGRDRARLGGVASDHARRAARESDRAREPEPPARRAGSSRDDRKALNQEIEGYASKTSVNKGSSIDLMVNLSTNSTQYTMDIYRMGWYPTGTNPDGSSCAPSCGGTPHASRRAPDGVATADLPAGHDAERPELRAHRVQLDAELHAQRPRVVDERHLPRQAQARRRTAARELHDLRRPRRREHRGCPVFARCDARGTPTTTGAARATTTSATASTAATTTSRGTTRATAPSRSRSIARTRTARSTTAPASSSTGTTR